MATINYNSVVTLASIYDWLADEVGVEPDLVTRLEIETTEVTIDIMGAGGVINTIRVRVQRDKEN